METAVLVPVKAFTAAKGRLSVILDRVARADLARWLAGRVVAAAGELPTFIACDDDEVAAWADEHGAEVLWSPGMGLNGAVDNGRSNSSNVRGRSASSVSSIASNSTTCRHACS